MDDTVLQQWSDKLSEFRSSRQTSIKRELDAKRTSFSPADFLAIATHSMEAVASQWFTMEQAVWAAQESTPAASVKAELDSVLDLELEAIQRDLEDVRSHVVWNDEDARNTLHGPLEQFVNQLRSSFYSKVDAIVAGRRKKAQATAQTEMSQSSRSSAHAGRKATLAFVVGLLIGLVPSYFIWLSQQAATKKFDEERAALLQEKSKLEDNIGFLGESVQKLASGEWKGLSEVDRQIGEVKQNFAKSRERMDKEFTLAQARLKKRPGQAGSNQLSSIQSERETKISQLQKEEEAALTPLLEQKKILETLLSR